MYAFPTAGGASEAPNGETSTVTPGDSPEACDEAVLRVLTHRFGDGLVYLHDAGERHAYRRAIALGLVGHDGYLTPAGLALAHRFD